jgi:tRNA1(Val) A37 N6-methylase TrmN6
MTDLTQIQNWKKNFGLLPIHINPLIAENKFLMLNGGQGDFCLQICTENENEDSYFSQSWSTNTKNFIVLNGSKVKIYNWLKKDSDPETLDVKNIENNKDKFYKYLLSKSYKTQNDVIPFILGIFRQLRNITQEKENPVDTINLLYKLLISLEDNYNEIDYNKWQIDDVTVPKEFKYFVDMMKMGVKDITPKLDLILRHVSGNLFQEAHREVIYFDSQRNIFGGMSNKMTTKSNIYSSIHYTPQYLARSIVENSLKELFDKKSYSNLKIFDPACGSAEFLIEVLKQLKSLNYKGKIQIIGWDNSESAVNTAKFLLQYEKNKQWNNDLQFKIKLVKDSLGEVWDNDYDLILMNPPFSSWSLLDKNSKESVRSTLADVESKRKTYNQSSAFFYKSVQCLNEEGVIGCVLPSNFLASDTNESVRNELNEIINLKLIAKLGSFVFENALVDVSFLIAKKPNLNQFPKLLWVSNEKGIVQDALRDLRRMDATNQQTIEENKYNIYVPSIFPLQKNSWQVFSLKDEKLAKDLEQFVIENKLVRLSSIFSVQQGIRQGKKNIFKISKDQYKNISEKNLFRPVVDNSSIKNGQLFYNSYIWYPYDRGGIIHKDENELAHIPFFINTIKPLEISLKNRKGIKDKEWWGHTRPRNWMFEKKIKLVSTEFGKSDSFAVDNTGEFVVERGYDWIPKKEFEINDYYFYLACFSSNFFDLLLLIYSKQLARGKSYDLSKKYTKNIPIPNVAEIKTSKGYHRIVELGRELEKGNLYVKFLIDDVLSTFFYPKK